MVGYSPGDMLNRMKIFSGSSNPALAKKICDYLEISPAKASIRRFSDGETFVEIGENVRGMDVYAIQSTHPPGNDHLMELLIMIDALKRASADRITSVLPYYGYARQDRKVAPRTPISAKLVADLLTTAGAHRILTMDLHAGQIQGFFNIPVDNIFATPVLLNYVKEHFASDLVIVSPDAGGMERARAYAKRLDSSLAMIDKRRPAQNVAEVMNVVGDVAGKKAVLVDDIVDTGGTLVQAAQALIGQGAKEAYACCTHPILSGPALERVEKSVIKEVVVTDTVPLKEDARRSKKITVLSVAELLGEAIKRIHEGSSVSSLFV